MANDPTITTRFKGDDADFQRAAGRVEQRANKLAISFRSVFGAVGGFAGGFVLSTALQRLESETEDLTEAFDKMAGAMEPLLSAFAQLLGMAADMLNTFLEISNISPAITGAGAAGDAMSEMLGAEIQTDDYAARLELMRAGSVQFRRNRFRGRAYEEELDAAGFSYANIPEGFTGPQRFGFYGDAAGMGPDIGGANLGVFQTGVGRNMATGTGNPFGWVAALSMQAAQVATDPTLRVEMEQRDYVRFAEATLNPFIGGAGAQVTNAELHGVQQEMNKNIKEMNENIKRALL